MYKVLVITYFPNLRTLKFVEYLPIYDFKPILLTAKKPLFHSKNINADAHDNIYYSLDPIPFELISSLLRLRTNYRLLFLPDIYISWIFQTTLKALNIVKRYPLKIRW